MRRRGLGGRPGILAGLGLALVAVIAITLSLHHHRPPEAAAPEVLQHIANRNRDAAREAAAVQRANSIQATSDANRVAAAATH